MLLIATTCIIDLTKTLWVLVLGFWLRPPLDYWAENVGIRRSTEKTTGTDQLMHENEWWDARSWLTCLCLRVTWYRLSFPVLCSVCIVWKFSCARPTGRAEVHTCPSIVHTNYERTDMLCSNKDKMYSKDGLNANNR